MDYDENECQTQNKPLATEENSNFPPVLRPYALPKFDFDDNLQGSLRFDGLVETGDFLGIENHEDNQWIEDYSRGAGEIQFSSGATGPCTISRHTNVWSEAASSESVEMLLKSVGQEEVVPLPTNDKLLDSCDELGCIMKQMEPNLAVDRTSSDERDTNTANQEVLLTPQDIVESGNCDPVLISDRVLNNLDPIGVSSLIPIMSSDAFVNENLDDTNNCKNSELRNQLNDLESIDPASEMQDESSVSYGEHTTQKELNMDMATPCVGIAVTTNCNSPISSPNIGTQVINDSIPQVAVLEAANVSVSCSSLLDADVEPSVAKATTVDVAEDPYESLPKFETDVSNFYGKESIVTNALNHVDESNIYSESVEFSISCTTHLIDEKSCLEKCVKPLLQDDADVSMKHATDLTRRPVDDHSTETNSVTKHFDDENFEIIGKEDVKVGEDVTDMLRTSKKDITTMNEDVPDRVTENIDFPSDVQKNSSPLSEKVVQTAWTEPAPSDDAMIQAVDECASGSPLSSRDQTIYRVNDEQTETLVKITNMASPPAIEDIPPENCDIVCSTMGERILQVTGSETEFGLASKSALLTEIVERTTIEVESDYEERAGDHELNDAELEGPKVLVACENSLIPSSTSDGETLTIAVSESFSHDGQLPTNSLNLVTGIHSDSTQQLEHTSDKNNETEPLDKSDLISGSREISSCKGDTSPKIKQIEAPKKANSFNPSGHGAEASVSSEQVIPTITQTSHSVGRRNSKASGAIASQTRTKGNSEQKPRKSSSRVKESAKKSKETLIHSSNASASSQHLQSPAMFQQPFTDGQQVQLRAQIFVYGALIQGIVPEEAYMVSSFDGNDGARNLWEKAWRLCLERQQKLHLNTPETPLLSRLGSRASDQAVKQGSLESKLASSVSQLNSKGTTYVSPMLPFSAPLWSMASPSVEILPPSGPARGSVADFHRSVVSVHPQNSPIRNFVRQSPWLSQSPFGGPWVASPSTSVPDTTSRLPVQKLTFEPAHHSSASKLMSSSPIAQLEFASGIDSEVPTAKPSNNLSTPVHSVSETKSRKRKKSTISQNTTESMIKLPHSLATDILPATAENSNRFLSTGTYTDLIKVNENIEERSVLPEDVLAKIKEARIHAEAASFHASMALNHNHEMWKQLDHQKNVGLLPENERKLSSAILSVTAAVSVAKAAAAAASVASNAALQAKMMVDEALGSHYNGISDRLFPLPNNPNNLGMASPVSILKGDDGVNSSIAILGAARETARRRVEAASAASMQAENMDALVKAAELAADAVSQAGKIVSMADPSPLSELIANRDNTHLRTKQARSGSQSRPKGDQIAIPNVQLKDKEKISEDNLKLVDVRSNILSEKGSASGKEGKLQKGRKLSDFSKSDRLSFQSETEFRSPHSYEAVNKLVAAVEIQSDIKEGSLVEVYKESSELKAAWYCAHVLSIRQGKAHVCYTDLMLGEEKVKEWVELKSEGEKPPKIRIARPTNLPFEGTRKRRRAALEICKWSVSDRVDAWIMNSWWEGVVSEINPNDDSLLKFYCPANGESVSVKPWHLRPSLIWENGEWKECSRLEEKTSYSLEGDAPAEKRTRIKSPILDSQQKDKLEPTLLDLTAGEKLFNTGKTSQDHRRPGTLKMTRTGLQKEGSRVVFGVPKPGKKRKFMDVSKHYVADQSSKSSSEPNENTKFVKYLMPQGPSRGSSKNISSKPKQAKPQTAFGRSIPQKGHHPSMVFSASDESRATLSDFIAKSKLAASHNTENSSRSSKGKLAPASEKLEKIEEEKADKDAEPRRSNRRIQPTSRLLEGLQTSLTVPKLPAVRHFKR